MYNDSPLLHYRSGLKRGVGRTQDQHRLFILRSQPGHVPCMIAWFLWFFERCIFFSLDPNRSDCSQREKDGRPGSHNYTNKLPMNLIPQFSFHLVRKTAMETDRINARLLITNQVGNPFSPFCFADDDEDRLSTVEHQANGLLQQSQSIGPGSLHQNPSGSLASQRPEQWLRPRHGWVNNEGCRDAEIDLVRLFNWLAEGHYRGRE